MGWADFPVSSPVAVLDAQDPAAVLFHPVKVFLIPVVSRGYGAHDGGLFQVFILMECDYELVVRLVDLHHTAPLEGLGFAYPAWIAQDTQAEESQFESRS